MFRYKSNDSKNVPMFKKLRKKAVALIILATMSGVGWIFGILGSIPTDAINFPAQVIFVLIIGFQGFLIFLFHPCRSKEARKEWKKWFYCLTCRYQDPLKLLSQNTSKPGTLSSSNISLFSSSSTLTRDHGTASKSGTLQLPTLYEENDILPDSSTTKKREVLIFDNTNALMKFEKRSESSAYVSTIVFDEKSLPDSLSFQNYDFDDDSDCEDYHLYTTGSVNEEQDGSEAKQDCCEA